MKIRQSEVFQEQVFGIVMTLCKIYESEGLTTKQSQHMTAEFLSNIAKSLESLSESEEN